MTSILSNAGAISALQTLRSINCEMMVTEGRISSGLRVRVAADNAAYWSISTTMKSDVKALGAVADALGLGAAKVDVSYSALSSVKDVLDEIKAKLVAASEPGVDKSKIQKEIDQLAQTTRDIADSASFAGENWLSTDIVGLIDTTLPKRSSTLVSSFNRSASGNVGIGTTTIDQLATALFNRDGGGILQRDPRSPKSIAGMRFDVSYLPKEHYLYSPTGWSDYTLDRGSAGSLQIDFAGPLDFASSSDAITFNLTIDAEDPSSAINPPFHPGITSLVTIDRSVIDGIFPGKNGVIDTKAEWVRVLESVLNPLGASANRATFGGYPDRFAISSMENRGLNGSAVQIANFTSTIGSSGLYNGLDYGERGSSIDLVFDPFTVFESMQINFDVQFNRETPTSHVIDRALVNSVLGTDDGLIANSVDWAKILNALITRPDTIIDATSATTVNVKTDTNVDRLNGGQTQVHFKNIVVNIEPISQTGIFDIDIVDSPGKLEAYITDVEIMTQRVVDGAAMLGAIKTRVDMQSLFTSRLKDTIDRGIGRLVDADMNEDSTRLKALQTQQQLGIQALQIANSNSENIMQLFR
jgi:flagellin